MQEKVAMQNKKNKIFLVHGIVEGYMNNELFYPKNSGGFHSTDTLKRFELIADEVIILGRVKKPKRKEIERSEPLLFKNIDVINTKKNIFFTFYNILKAVKKADFVLIRMPSFEGVLAGAIARIKRKKYAIEVVGNGYESLTLHSTKGKLIAKPMNYLFKKTIMNCNYVSYITSNYLQKIYKTKGLTFDFITNVTINRTLSDQILEKRNILINSNNKVIKIGMVASYSVKYKAHDILLKAISHLMRNNTIDPNTIIVELVGSNDKTRLYELSKILGIEDQVRFLGTIQPNKIYSWLDTIDIYCQPSRTEAQGRTVIEAMSRGCHVITTDVGGMRELVDENFRFPLDDYKELSSKIINAVNDKGILYKSAKNNINKSLTFDKEIIEEKRMTFYKQAFISEATN